jgi:hypothetical protein
MALDLTIKSFEENATIPERYTCEGENIAPHLIWNDVPKETVSQALVMEDPDAPGGTFSHWVLYNIPPEVTELDNIPMQKNLDNGAIHGQNDFDKYGYGGPCPPHPEEHRYIFKLFALKRKLRPEEGQTRESLLESIKNDIIDQGAYTGKFKR